MTTATAPRKRQKQPDPLAERKLEEAQAERARLGDEATAYFDGINQAQAEFDHIARTATEQFGPDGQPTPKSKAASLREQIDRVASNNWRQVLQGADQRIGDRTMQRSASSGAKTPKSWPSVFEAGRDDLRELDRLADQMLDVIGRLRGREASLTQVAIACPGLDGRDVGWDPALNELAKLLETHRDIQPPRLSPVTPYTDEEPRKIRHVQGGWLPVEHAEPHPDQPERVERGR